MPPRTRNSASSSARPSANSRRCSSTWRRWPSKWRRRASWCTTRRGCARPGCRFWPRRVRAAKDEVKPEEIIRKFAAKELEFQTARNNYTYRQSVKMEEVQGGGKWEEVDDIIFTPEGKRIEKVVYAPVISLHHISLSP